MISLRCGSTLTFGAVESIISLASYSDDVEEFVDMCI